MNHELSLSVKKHTDPLIEQTKTKPQETREFKLNKPKKSFSFNPPINLSEERKRLLKVTNFEATNSVFNLPDENNSFSITTSGRWNSKSDKKTFVKLKGLLDFRSQNDSELHVDQVSKKG